MRTTVTVVIAGCALLACSGERDKQTSSNSSLKGAQAGTSSPMWRQVNGLSARVMGGVNTEEVDIAGVRIGMSKENAVQALIRNGFEVTQEGGFDPDYPGISLTMPRGAVTGTKGIEKVTAGTVELPGSAFVAQVEYRRIAHDMTNDEMTELVAQRYPQFGPIENQFWGYDARDVREMQRTDSKRAGASSNQYPILVAHLGGNGITLTLEGGRKQQEYLQQLHRDYQAEQNGGKNVSF